MASLTLRLHMLAPDRDRIYLWVAPGCTTSNTDHTRSWQEEPTVVGGLISLWRDRLVDKLPHQQQSMYVSVEAGANWLLKHNPKAWTKAILSVNFHRLYSVSCWARKRGETQGSLRRRPRDLARYRLADGMIPPCDRQDRLTMRALIFSDET